MLNPHRIGLADVSGVGGVDSRFHCGSLLEVSERERVGWLPWWVVVQHVVLPCCRLYSSSEDYAPSRL